MVLAEDNKWRVSVDGQLDIPFDKHEDALAFAAGMQEDGFDAFLYFSPSKHKPTKQ